MSRALSPVTGKVYGLAAVCRVWQLARSGVYRHLCASQPSPAQRRGPRGAMSDEALTAAIRGVLAASPFHGEGHRKVWARLRHAGTRTSLRRVLRLMRQNNLLAPTRTGAPRGPRSHDGTIIPDTVDAMWGTDLTTTITGEGQAAVFIAIDHGSAECVGIHAHARATRFQALEPIRQGVRQRFGGFAKAVAQGRSPRVWRCATITARNTCPITSRRNWPSSASRAHPPSCGHRKAMAALSGSSAPSKRTYCGCGPSRPSRSCGRRCSRSGKPTTTPG
jgi:putative transposase